MASNARLAHGTPRCEDAVTKGGCFRERVMLRTILLACVLVTASVAVHAGAPEIPRFRLVDVADGLPSTTIPALARDRHGYLWAATWDGLTRYDGIGFKTWRYDPNDPSSLSGNVVQALHIDQQDRIWVATESSGLSMLDADRKAFRHFRQGVYPGMESDDVFAIASQGDDLWFGTFGEGLYRLSADGGITRYASDEGNPEGLPSDTVLSLAFDSRGDLWIGTMAGLARYDGTAIRRVPAPDGGGPIVYSVTPDGDALWVGTGAGAYRRLADGQWDVPAWSRMFARPNAIMAMVNSGDGEYWIGSQSGLWRTEGKGAPVPVRPGNESRGVGRVMQSLLLQPDGGLWVPFPTLGLGYLPSDWRRVAGFTSAQGLEGGLYRALASSSRGGTWLGSSLGVIEHLDHRSGEVVPLGLHAEVLKKQRISALMEDSRRQLWIGHRNGIARIGLETGELRSWLQGVDVDAPPAGGSIEWLVEALDGSVWLYGQAGGMQRRDGGSGRVLDHFDATSVLGAALSDVQRLEFDPEGVLWVAGKGGLMRWRADARDFETVVDPGEERVLDFVFQDADTLWLHRLSGLETWRRDGTGHWRQEKHLSATEGVPMVESTGLRMDAQGQLWLATRRGLFRIDADSGRVRHFGVRDGLPSQEFNERALMLAPDGVLVGSAADGSVVLLDTTLADPAPQVPSLMLDGVQVGRHDHVVALPVQGDFELRHDDHELQVSARLLSFRNPQSNRYRSLLEGFDHEWVDQGSSGERVFSSLAPGRYTLRMQGIDALGNLSQERTLVFRVLPPWWSSRWGIALFVLLGALLLGLAALAYRQRLRRLHAWQLAEHKREIAEQASLAKTRFLATLAHEVRTPLTGVMGMSELLLETPLQETQRNHVHSLRQAGHHLLHLVNDALDLARIEAGKLELAIQDFDPRALMAEAQALIAPLAKKRGLSFVVEVAPELPGALQGDPVRIRQILLNLLGNAVKFTEQGGIALHVGMTEAGQVRMRVTDTGPGLSEEQLQRVFRRFEQAEGVRTAVRYGGSGLGLAICQELVVAMEGRIHVESTPGSGTSFMVDLRLPEAASPARVAPESVVRTMEQRPLEVLLVEDDATVADVITGMLHMRGHRVTHVVHGLSAMGLVAERAFDIALLDLDLPGLDGLALAGQLRAQGFNAPLLAITARVDMATESQAMACGFAGFLRKPLGGDVLAAAMAAALASERPDVPGQGPAG